MQKNKQIGTRFDTDTWRRLETMSAREGRTKSDLIQTAVLDFLDFYDDEQDKIEKKRRNTRRGM